MQPLSTRKGFHWIAAGMGLFLLVGTAATSSADVILLRNGMEVQGNFGETSTLGSDVLSPLGASNSGDVKLIRFVDDGLRRTFFSRYQVESRRPDVEQFESIRIDQPTATTGKRLGLVGPLAAPPTALDEHGRRTLQLTTDDGTITIVQGITQITPVFVRLQGLQTSQPFDWDMRVATSSFPRDQLLPVLRSAIDADQADDRLKLVRFFLQAESYGDAEAELRDAIERHPELAEQGDQIAELQRVRTRQFLQEVRLRFNAGQYALASSMMNSLPIKDLPVEVLVEVQVVSEEFEKLAAQIAQCKEILTRIRDTLQDDVMREELVALLDEIIQGLNPATVPRMAELLRAEPLATTTNEQRLALAISGWLTADAAQAQPQLARSLVKVRRIAGEYLNSDSETQRQVLLNELESEEAGTPYWISKILGAMPPPRTRPAPEPVQGETPVVKNDAAVDADATVAIPGLFQIEVAGIRPDSAINYVVQLPPEYDPNRKYPAIVALHAGGGSPQDQILWWSGAYHADMGIRLGQAARQGYVVIAPAWSRPNSRKYEYSAYEHAAVVASLRDACQRFSIDSDRVFLAGHGAGADAAWDIGLAHPDLWAGVVVIGGTSHYGKPTAPRYITHYWPNAKYVPLYFIGGELDAKRTELNATDFNRYLRRTGFDVMIVEYRGRGSEPFSDEIQRLFRWMSVHRRDFFPKEFDVVTRRPWDNFFWYVEMQGLPERAMISSAAWPAPDAAKPFPLAASVREESAVHVNTNAGQVTVYFSPEMVDFDRRITVRLNGRKRSLDIAPSSAVLLEDARTRGDRQHPFWAKGVIVRQGY